MLVAQDNFVRGTAEPIGVKYVKMSEPTKQRIFADPRIGRDLLNQKGQYILNHLRQLGFQSLEFFGGLLRDVDGNPGVLVINLEEDGWKPGVRLFNQLSETFNAALVLDPID